MDKIKRIKELVALLQKASYAYYGLDKGFRYSDYFRRRFLENDWLVGILLSENLEK